MLRQIASTARLTSTRRSVAISTPAVARLQQQKRNYATPSNGDSFANGQNAYYIEE
jgi:hypothetical protein